MEKRDGSRSKVTMSQLMLPADANPMGNVHGGTIMKLIDSAGAVAAMRYSRVNVVTACIDELNFAGPVQIGDLIILDASVTYVHKSSIAMEVEVKVKSENLKTGVCVDVVFANLVFVTEKDERGQRIRIPQLIPVTEEDKKKYKEGMERKRMRREKSLRLLEWDKNQQNPVRP